MFVADADDTTVAATKLRRSSGGRIVTDIAEKGISGCGYDIIVGGRFFSASGPVGG